MSCIAECVHLCRLHAVQCSQCECPSLQAEARRAAELRTECKNEGKKGADLSCAYYNILSCK